MKLQERFPEADLEEKMNCWVRKEFKNFNEDVRLSIKHWKDSWHKRVYKKKQRRVRDNPEDYFSNHSNYGVLVETKQKARILELKRRHIEEYYSDYQYAVSIKKIQRIRACTHQIPQRIQAQYVVNLDNSTSNVLIPRDSWTSDLLVYKEPLSRLACLGLRKKYRLSLGMICPSR
ncbi:hypothetical protein Tco_0774195 [Tanacetum coccineum]|uniref:Uncharacterized protein n=1 Tax=Tanacetum coccineum TaxID=301880 RepID=A0ABQ4ZMY2_9ASTR